MQKIIKDDRSYVWHPYASASDKNPIYPVKKAKGTYIYLETGENNGRSCRTPFACA